MSEDNAEHMFSKCIEYRLKVVNKEVSDDALVRNFLGEAVESRITSVVLLWVLYEVGDAIEKGRSEFFPRGPIGIGNDQM